MNKYEHFFFESQKASSQKGTKIQILKSEMLTEFMNKIANDNDIDIDTKIMIGLLLSGGARVSEALAINMRDISIKSGQIIVKIEVLKLKTKTQREIVVHPALFSVFEKKIASKRYNEQLFTERATKRSESKTLSARQVNRNLKKYFGNISAHSFRHANVAFLMSKGLTHIQISSILKMSLRNVENYAHTQSVNTMSELFAA